MKGKRCKCRQTRKRAKKVCMEGTGLKLGVGGEQKLVCCRQLKKSKLSQSIVKADVRQGRVKPGGVREGRTAISREERTTG